MTFVTYENRRNPHITIHVEGCGQIGKNGGTHKYGQGEYRDHVTYAEAHSYAKSTGWEIWPCSFCKPESVVRADEVGNGRGLPEEVIEAEELVEGAASRVWVNAFERNSDARRRCIEHYGTNCGVCGIDLGAVYGEVAKGLIHVHHLRPLSGIGREYRVDPIGDLRPVCPNCHAVLHRRNPAYSIEDVRACLVNANAMSSADPGD